MRIRLRSSTRIRLRKRLRLRRRIFIAPLLVLVRVSLVGGNPRTGRKSVRVKGRRNGGKSSNDAA